MTKTYEKFIILTSTLFRNLAKQTPNILYYESNNNLQQNSSVFLTANVLYGICTAY